MRVPGGSLPSPIVMVPEREKTVRKPEDSPKQAQSNSRGFALLTLSGNSVSDFGPWAVLTETKRSREGTTRPGDGWRRGGRSRIRRTKPNGISDYLDVRQGFPRWLRCRWESERSQSEEGGTTKHTKNTKGRSGQVSERWRLASMRESVQVKTVIARTISALPCSSPFVFSCVSWFPASFHRHLGFVVSPVATRYGLRGRFGVN